MRSKDAQEEAAKPPQDLESGRYPANEPTSFSAVSQPEGLKVVTIAPGTVSQPDVEGGNALDQAAQSDPYLGCTVDNRYKVEAILGEGGMGVVYRCRHKIIGKKVAMKVLRADLARDSEVTERFLNEAKAASSIGNPHIIDISDFGQFPDGATYFVMEYLEGMPLSGTIVDKQPLPIARIISIAEQLAEGLSAAHRSQIVHRDLKPDNIFLISRGSNHDFVKILDFGIAKVSTSEGKLTRAGAVFGTPHYMSPEQAAGTPVDHRGDIYSVGVILYELASGSVPFDADNFMGILTQHMYKVPVPIRALVPQRQEVPAGLEAIILKCLSKRPEQRYASMEELLQDLVKFKQGVPPDAVAEMLDRSGSFQVPHDYFQQNGAVAVQVPDSAPTLKGRRTWMLALAGAGAATLVAVTFMAGSGTSDSAPIDASAHPEPLAASATQLKTTNAPTVDPAPPPRRVVLAVEPLDAHVFQDGTDLGQSPVFVDVDKGQQQAVRIEREGYETETILLDGSEPRRSVRLTPDKKPAPTRPPKPGTKPRKQRAPKPPKKPSNIGSSEIINPWG